MKLQCNTDKIYSVEPLLNYLSSWVVQVNQNFIVHYKECQANVEMVNAKQFVGAGEYSIRVVVSLTPSKRVMPLHEQTGLCHIPIKLFANHDVLIFPSRFNDIVSSDNQAVV